MVVAGSLRDYKTTEPSTLREPSDPFTAGPCWALPGKITGRGPIRQEGLRATWVQRCRVGLEADTHDLPRLESSSVWIERDSSQAGETVLKQGLTADKDLVRDLQPFPDGTISKEPSAAAFSRSALSSDWTNAVTRMWLQGSLDECDDEAINLYTAVLYNLKSEHPDRQEVLYTLSLPANGTRQPLEKTGLEGTNAPRMKPSMKLFSTIEGRSPDEAPRQNTCLTKVSSGVTPSSIRKTRLMAASFRPRAIDAGVVILRTISTSCDHRAIPNLRRNYVGVALSAGANA